MPLSQLNLFYGSTRWFGINYVSISGSRPRTEFRKTKMTHKNVKKFHGFSCWIFPRRSWHFSWSMENSLWRPKKKYCKFCGWIFFCQPTVWAYAYEVFALIHLVFVTFDVVLEISDLPVKYEQCEHQSTWNWNNFNIFLHLNSYRNYLFLFPAPDFNKNLTLCLEKCFNSPEE